MKKWNKLTIFLIPIGIAVNVVGGQLALMLKLPVFLDSIGTFVVAALTGIGPGLIIAIGTQLINAITTPTVLAYIEIGMLFSVWSFLFAKGGIYKSLWKSALCGVGVAVVDCCLSDNSVFPWRICRNRSNDYCSRTDGSRMGRIPCNICQ